MVLTRPAVSNILQSGAACHCQSASAPDDMHLGRCSMAAGVKILHSPRMFQARPTDYPAAQISNRRPISFHKHWNIDPLQVYEEYFKSSDKILAQSEHKQEL
jgi:UDP-glucose:O-linked fucose beta-1,3-glucosyltransferase